MHDPKNISRKDGSLTSELLEMDSALVKLLGKRSRLFKKAAAARKQKKKSLVDPQQEKALWRNWRQWAEANELDEKMMRTLFNAVNGLGYEQAERKQDWELPLRPNPEPVRIELDGPRDCRQSRIWVFLAAASGSPLQLSPVILNDPLFELIKALNQAGGSFYWEQDRVLFRGDGTLDFDAKTIFCGQDPFNLYLLLFLAARKPGVCRFSGGSRLKLVDLRALETLIRDLGGRVISLVPGSHGLPLRLEAGGAGETAISIAPEVSDEMLQALIMALAATLQEGEAVKLQQVGAASGRFQFQGPAAVLEACGCCVEQLEGGCLIQGRALSIPESVDPPLDPLLCGFLLAMACVSRGRVHLRGCFPEQGLEAEAVLQLLKDAGLALERQAAEIRGAFEGRPGQTLSFDARGTPQALPLALALAVSRQGPSQLRVDSGEDLDFALLLLDLLKAEYSIQDQVLDIHSGLNLQHCPPLKIHTVNAWWSMALAVIALKRPKMSVQNPGELTRLWPQFWSLFKGLPDPQRNPAKKRAEPQAGARQKIRRKIE